MPAHATVILAEEAAGTHCIHCVEVTGQEEGGAAQQSSLCTRGEPGEATERPPHPPCAPWKVPRGRRAALPMRTAADLCTARCAEGQAQLREPTAGQPQRGGALPGEREAELEHNPRGPAPLGGGPRDPAGA